MTRAACVLNRVVRPGGYCVAGSVFFGGGGNAVGGVRQAT